MASLSIILLSALLVMKVTEATLPHIYNDPAAAPHQYPWMVTLIHTWDGMCGGALIRVRKDIMESDVVLTAAHCVTAEVYHKRGRKCTGNACTCDNNCKWIPLAGYMVTIMGNHAISQLEVGEEAKSVIAVSSHPCWQGNHSNCDPPNGTEKLWYSHDIGLAILDTPQKFTAKIQPLDLPEENEKVAPQGKCIPAGWGDHTYKTNEQQKSHSDVLRTVNMTFITEQQKHSCAKAYGYGIEQLDTFLCAITSGTNSTACQGDSGGPIWCQSNEGKQKVYGVVSANDGYCGGTRPAVFSNVAMFSNWLKSEINRLSAVAKKEPQQEPYPPQDPYPPPYPYPPYY